MNKGLNYLQTFNPVDSAPELLEHTLIGRRDLVDGLEELVIESSKGGNKYQRLIIGPRGSGKTHVLKVLYNRIFKQPELSKKIEIAYLVEDEYGVATFLDFIVRILRSFVRWYPERTESLVEEIEKLKKVPKQDQEKIAAKILLNQIKGKTLIIIVENIGNVFHEKKGFGKKGQQKFRDLIQQYPYFTIISSNQALFEDIQKEDMPFHNFFKIDHLKKLSLDEALLFLKSIAKWDKNLDLLKFLDTDEGRGKNQAIYDLVGGNHRLLVSFYNFLKSDYINKLSESFIKTINNLIPYFQSMMDQLTAQQQKIVQHLCQIRIPSNVKNIAENCFSTHNIISKQIVNLVRLKYVYVAESSGRETFYELSEPLLRICNELKENRGGPIKLFIDFLGSLYTSKEIKRKYMYYHVLAEITEKHESADYLHEQIYYKEALKRYFPEEFQSDDLTKFEKAAKQYKIKFYIEELEKTASYQDVIAFTTKYKSEDRYVLLKEASAYEKIGNIEKEIVTANKILRKNKNDIEALLLVSGAWQLKENIGESTKFYDKVIKIESNNIQALIGQGKNCFYLENYREAEKYFKKVILINPDDEKAIEYIGHSQSQQGNHRKANRYFKKLTKLQPDNSESWRLLGNSLVGLGKSDEAKKCYLKALKLDDKNAGTVIMLGLLSKGQGNHQEAHNYFGKLTKLDPDNFESWQLLGDSQVELKEIEEAKKSFLKAIELDDNNADAIMQLGVLLVNQGNYQEAQNYFEKWTKLKPDNSESWRLLGVSLFGLKQIEEAKKSYLKSIELDVKNVDAMLRLGALLGNQGNYHEAYNYFDKLTKLQPDHSESWRLLGVSQVKLKQIEEGKKSFLKSIELDDKNAVAIMNLGTIFGSQGNYQEAHNYFDKSTKLQPDHSVSWGLLGDSLVGLNEFVEAKKSYHKALKLDDKIAGVIARLGWLSSDQGNHQEACNYFKKLTKLEPDKSEAWMLLGNSLVELKQNEEAKKSYLKALKLDDKNVKAKIELAEIFIKENRNEKAKMYIDEVIKENPKDHVNNSVGEIFRKDKQYEKAIKYYQMAIDIDRNYHSSYINIVTCLIGLGRVEEAVLQLKATLDKAKDLKLTNELIEGFEENIGTLLMFASAPDVLKYFKEASILINKYDYTDIFMRSFPSSVFELLKEHQSIDIKRFQFIANCLSQSFPKVKSMIMPLKFLDIGVRHLKMSEKNALIQFTKEERETFKKFVLDQI